jgi:hypothetical protein
MKRLPQLLRPNTTNIPGVDLLRLIDVRDVAGMISEEELWAKSKQGLLDPADFVLEENAEWITVLISSANLNEISAFGVQGVAVKKELTLVLAGYTDAEKMELVKLIHKGRWLAIVVDGNDCARLVGTKEHPLKFEKGKAGTSPNVCDVQLNTSGLYHAPFLTDFDPFAVWGNPAVF